MINILGAYAYCSEDISKIENYDKAIADKTQTWHCHHKLEVQGQFKNSAALLQKCGLYYNVPAWQLIFLPRKEHCRLHGTGFANPRFGTTLSKYTKQRISKSNKGKHMLTVEHRRILSEVNKSNKHSLGKHHTEEAKKKISKAHKGKIVSDETRRKMSEAAKIREARKRGKLCQ